MDEQDDLPKLLPMLFAGEHDEVVGRIRLIPTVTDRLMRGEPFVMSGMLVDRRLIGVDLSHEKAFPPVEPSPSRVLPPPYPDQLPVIEDWDPINYVGLVHLDIGLMHYLAYGCQFTFGAVTQDRSKMIAACVFPVPALPRRHHGPTQA